MDTAFTGVEGQLGITAACRLTGRSRATHYRRLKPPAPHTLRIGWHTPASVHFGTAEEVRDQRAVTLAGAYARHPERFGRRPTPPEIPRKAWINDPAKRRETEPQTS
ncbi:hypothetical protein ACFV27_09675 [Streptomyces antimycoticus]|uniref:hypothetical protein n=1 Tax=Streptomyces antimycoticus TaxID=68175 RepID=UPI0036C19772